MFHLYVVPLNVFSSEGNYLRCCYLVPNQSVEENLIAVYFVFVTLPEIRFYGLIRIL